MSRRGPSSSFVSRGMYDVLGEDDVDVEEVESEEEQTLEPVQNTETTPEAPEATLSKSARKKLAKLASKTSETATATAEVVRNSAAAATEAVPALSEDVKSTITTAVDSLPSTADVKNAVSQLSEAIPSTEEAEQATGIKDTSDPTSSNHSEVKVNGVAPTASSKSAPKINGHIETEPASSSSTSSTVATTGKAKPPTSSFAPALPSTLPELSGNSLPSNRKRKQPKDFTPSGPGNVTNASSPSKIGVKFEDGVAPGEGLDGEKIITPKKAPLFVIKKDRNVIERTVWTFIMIGGFITLLCLGPPYLILLVMLCQSLVYKEVTALFDLRDHGSHVETSPTGEKGDRWSKTLNWYFFVVVNYFLYGESIIYYFKHIVFVGAYFIPFARNHRFISFMLYVVGFVGFVANLQRQYLRQQFALFCWVHISLLLIVVSSHFIVNNILEGLVWFFIPASLVICNDVMAYVCGKLFGRTPLIKLSPKKTVEGFVGAFLCTLLFGLAWGTFFMRFPYMICPARDLGTNVLSNITCRPNPVFVWRSFEFTGLARQSLQTLLGHAPPSIPYAPFQIHVLVMATFASLVAPFGGFFASGFKRAFNIKDFGHSIPGHGGMTDRMDCQFMMGLFSYVYYSSLIRIQYVTVGSIMQTVVTSLTAPEQLELLADLKRFLDGQGVKVA